MCMSKVGKEFTEDMKVVCEEFKVVFKLSLDEIYK